MTWIAIQFPGPSHPDLGPALEQAVRGYPPEYAPTRQEPGRVPELVQADSIVMAHSLIPAALGHFMAGYGALLDPGLPLTRRQHEMIATTVSALNQCFY
jgi:hypothetical protein